MLQLRNQLDNDTSKLQDEQEERQQAVVNTHESAAVEGTERSIGSSIRFLKGKVGVLIIWLL